MIIFGTEYCSSYMVQQHLKGMFEVCTVLVPSQLRKYRECLHDLFIIQGIDYSSNPEYQRYLGLLDVIEALPDSTYIFKFEDNFGIGMREGYND